MLYALPKLGSFDNVRCIARLCTVETMMNIRKLSIALLSLAIFSAPCILAAELLPRPGRLYTDPDPAAMASGPRQGDKAAWRRHLNEVIQKYPKDIVALSSRAYVKSMAGDYEGANEDYLRALAVADPDSASYRHILWSLGWSHFNIGDDAGALDFWQRAERQHGGEPYWVPYTVALSYWRSGKKDIALAYYDLAVKHNSDWGTDEGVHRMTHHWKPNEKKLHAELFAEYTKAKTD